MRAMLFCAALATLVLAGGCRADEQMGPTGPKKGAFETTGESASGQSDADRYYWVQKGDSLASIARKYYGDVRHWKRIAEANNIADPNHITPGQRLVIPPLE